MKGNQFAFMKDKHMLDSLLVANESIEEFSWKRKRGLVIKVYLETAYRTDWGFLEFVMEKKGAP